MPRLAQGTCGLIDSCVAALSATSGNKADRRRKIEELMALVSRAER